MNIVIIGSCLIATALLLSACQATSSSAPSRSAAFQQNQDGDPNAKRAQRCCQRAGRNGNN
jgi:hypothetical protein